MDTIKIKFSTYSYDFVTIKNVAEIAAHPITDSHDKYSPYNDAKWLQFCKLHGYNRMDVHSKYYNQYLRFCAVGLI